MDLIDHSDKLNLTDPTWKVYSEDKGSPAQVIGENAVVSSSYIDKGAVIDGVVKHSVISTDAIVEEGAVVTNTVLLPGVHISTKASVDYAIISENVSIGEGVELKGSRDKILLIDRSINK